MLEGTLKGCGPEITILNFSFSLHSTFENVHYSIEPRNHA